MKLLATTLSSLLLTIAFLSNSASAMDCGSRPPGQTSTVKWNQWINCVNVESSKALTKQADPQKSQAERDAIVAQEKAAYAAAHPVVPVVCTTPSCTQNQAGQANAYKAQADQRSIDCHNPAWLQQHPFNYCKKWGY